MKRHAALHGLSGEHHRALVLARRLRNLTQDVQPAAVQELLALWRAEVGPHFIAEEERLLPLFARYSAPDHPLIIETLRQHVLMRSLLDEIGELVDAHETPLAPLHALGDALREHVRFEENELFPAVEAALPEAQLQRLQMYFMSL
jgi:iron-sulfur cluster repair protein YtfE (RIC family)